MSFQGSSFVQCPCGTEHLVGDIQAIEAQSNIAYALCEKCSPFCIECGERLHDDYDIIDIDEMRGLCHDCDIKDRDQYYSDVYNLNDRQGILFPDYEAYE